MQKNGRCIVLVNGALVHQLPQVWQTHASLHVLSVVEAVGGHDPASELFGLKAIEIGDAGHAIFEVSIAKAAREVEFSIDAVLLSLLEHDSSPIYNLHQLLLIAQVVSSSQLVHFPLAVHAEQLAVAQVGHDERLLEQQQHQGSRTFFILFYNFSLHLFKHYHHTSLTFQHRVLWFAEDMRMRGQFPEELRLQEVSGLRIAVPVNNGEELQLRQAQLKALASVWNTRSRLSFLLPMWVKEVKFYSWMSVPLSSLPLCGDFSAEQEGQTLSLDQKSQSRSILKVGKLSGSMLPNQSIFPNFISIIKHQ